MVADLAVDSSVWVSALVRDDSNHERAQQFFREFRQGLHVCHLSRLVLVEVCAATLRRSESPGIALRIQQIFTVWGQTGLVRWYDLNAQRMNSAIEAATSYRLKGADAIMAALADELSVPLKTFDSEIIQRYPNTQA